MKKPPGTLAWVFTLQVYLRRFCFTSSSLKFGMTHVGKLLFLCVKVTCQTKEFDPDLSNSACCFQFTKQPVWLILLYRNHLMLLSAEEKNDCKRGASCMNLNRKKLLKLNVRSRILIPQRRA